MTVRLPMKAARSAVRTMPPGMTPQLQTRPAAGRRAAAGSRRIHHSRPAEVGNPRCTEADSRQVQGSQAEGSLRIQGERHHAEGMVAQLEYPVLDTRHVASSRLQEYQVHEGRQKEAQGRGHGAGRGTKILSSHCLPHSASGIPTSPNAWCSLRPVAKSRTLGVIYRGRHRWLEAAVCAQFAKTLEDSGAE